MTTNDRDQIARRLEYIAQAAPNPEDGNPDLPRDPWAPRWRIDSKWVEFECGCTAERCRELVAASNFDPVIFKNLDQQAVYSEVCSRHMPGMNKYIQMGYKDMDFETWKITRRRLIMGKV